MAKRRKRKGGKRRRNSASIRTTSAAAHKRVRVSTSKKRNPARRKSTGRKRNPLGLGGRIRPMEWAAAGAGAIVSEVASSLIPIGAVGSWLRIGVQLGTAVLLIPMVWPKSFHPEAATLGAAAAAAAKGLNKGLNLQGLLQNATAGLIPAASMPVPGSAGLSGFPGMARMGYRTA